MDTVAGRPYRLWSMYFTINYGLGDSCVAGLMALEPKNVI